MIILSDCTKISCSSRWRFSIVHGHVQQAAETTAGMSALCQKQTFRHSFDHLAWARATCAFALFLSITMSDEPIKLSLIKSKTLVVASEVRPADGGQEFMARHGIFSKYAQHLTGHHGHFAFVNTPRGHAFMNRLDHYGDTERL